MTVNSVIQRQSFGPNHNLIKMNHFLPLLLSSLIITLTYAAKLVTNSPDKWSCAIGWDCSDQLSAYESKLEVNPKSKHVVWKLIKDEPTGKGPFSVKDQKRLLTPVKPGNYVGFVGRITGKIKIYEAIVNLHGKEVKIEPPQPSVRGYTVEIKRSVRFIFDTILSKCSNSVYILTATR